jgi:hypothetical protein
MPQTVQGKNSQKVNIIRVLDDGSLVVANPDGSNIGGLTAGPTGVNKSSVGDTTTSTVLIDANSNRKEVEFYNTSTAILYLLKDGGVASSTNCTVAIQATGWYRTSYRGQITGVWASDAGGTVQITEST